MDFYLGKGSMSMFGRNKIDPGMKLLLTMLAAQEDDSKRTTAEAIEKVSQTDRKSLRLLCRSRCQLRHYPVPRELYPAYTLMHNNVLDMRTMFNNIPQMKQGDRTTIATVLTQKIGDETTISELAADFEYRSQSITYRRRKV